MADKIVLVGRGYIRSLVEKEYGYALPETRIVALMETIEKNVPEYYSARRKKKYGIVQRLWRRDEIEPYVKTLLRVRRRQQG